MLKSIAASPYAASLFGAVVVGVLDGVGATPEAVCCPTCGALVTCLLTLAAAKARKPDASHPKDADR